MAYKDLVAGPRLLGDIYSQGYAHFAPAESGKDSVGTYRSRVERLGCIFRSKPISDST